MYKETVEPESGAVRTMRTTKLSIFVIFCASFLVGIASGLGGYTFYYAQGTSYLTDDPTACANCHIMQAFFDGWQKSTHHAVAVCNDCHAPSGVISSFFNKAVNGYHHSKAFTTGDFHEPIRITEDNRHITERQCRRCHQEISGMLNGWRNDLESVSCTRCHRSVGHLY